MKKTFVLDTNILLSDSDSIFKFQENEIVIPLKTIQELDKFKRDMSDVGRSARLVSKHLDRLRQKGSLLDGVSLVNDIYPDLGELRIALVDNDAMKNIPQDISNTDDIFILSTAISEHIKGKNEVIFVSRDTNLRIIAASLGIKTQDYEADKVINGSGLYSGHETLHLSNEEIQEIFSNKKGLKLDTDKYNLLPNQFITAVNTSTSATAIGIHRAGYITHINGINKTTWGITARNKEQRFALYGLLDDSIQLMTINGRAGCGKTFLALAAGLQKTADENKYMKILAARPIYPMGKDLGYLPGDIEEKLNPWMAPIYDNVDHLLALDDEHGKKKRGYKELVDLGILQIEALTYIRGRSIPKQFIIIDEAQNLSPHEVKTIITRAGEGSKIILTGDIEQIDATYLDRTNNGLTYVIEKMKGIELSAHITLEKGERSELATIASELL